MFRCASKRTSAKRKRSRSFVLPCVIGNTTVSNALADLGASISVMPFSMFKRLGLGNPRPVNMVIEMADRSMQSPKGIVENVLVKIHKFIFSVDFVILDIVEDNKVPIILGRPMLATAHARIDVFGGKISLEVGKEQVIFNVHVFATKKYEFRVSSTRIHVVVRDQVSILAKDKGFGQEMHQSEETKALYDITSLKDYAVTYSNKEMSHHTLYEVKCLQDYAATFKYTRDDVSDSALRRNICDRVTP
ncbi:retrovirus-related pol polyprotein from transposon TNT 1-94 [Tanacetum coccineum]